MRPPFLAFAVAALCAAVAPDAGHAALFVGETVDADSGEPLPARVYVQSSDGVWRFVKTADPKGSALPYREQWVPTSGAVERHTTVSAHPFQVDLPPGRHSVSIERGKEYFPLHETLVIEDAPTRRTFLLKRWINMAARGWRSGETHVHRRLQELPNVMRAEDLNVAFPVTFWTVSSDRAPDLAPSPLRRQGPSPFGPRQDRGRTPILFDGDRAIFPRNTEYEIFSVRGRRHVLGALFILNHATPFSELAPPVSQIARRAREQGALLDLDKHSWPWAMMLAAVAQVDLFELANNSVWRTRFGFRRAGVALPPYMKLDPEGEGLTEEEWLRFGFENYYALLNCGFPMKPTAGTASGVHPVPLGHSRVYVHTDGPFTVQKWFDGLRAGRSFVTTGPMLFATVNGALPGADMPRADARTRSVRVAIETVSARPLDLIEVLVNGTVAAAPPPQNETTQAGAFRTETNLALSLDGSSWIAVRAFQPTPDGRARFAHTAPWRLPFRDEPYRPRREQIDYLIQRSRAELERNATILKDNELDEFRQALRVYEDIRDALKD